jgi:acyl carrier protein
MSNLEIYQEVFINFLNVEKDILKDLKYQDVPAWDSVGHMSLMTEIEEAFDIMIDMDDIIDFSSFEKGKELLMKYNVKI